MGYVMILASLILLATYLIPCSGDIDVENMDVEQIYPELCNTVNTLCLTAYITALILLLAALTMWWKEKRKKKTEK